MGKRRVDSSPSAVEWSAKWLMRDPDDENNITFVDSGSGDGYTYELGIWRDQVGVFDNTTILDPLWGMLYILRQPFPR